MLKIGLVGNGNIAKAHHSAYARLTESGKAQLVACCDIRPECLEGLEGVRVYTDVDEMLEKEKGQIDFIDVCVPTFLHAEIAIKALEAGFHVMSEKPMARTVKQAEQMVEAAGRTGKTLMIAYCNRFYSAAREIRDTILSGELGRPLCAEFYREGGSTGPMGWNNWFRDGELSGGAMLDLHVHDVDMIRWMFGMPQSVNAVASSQITKGGYDAMSVNFLYEDGLFVHALCNWTIAHDRFNTRSFRVNFEKGYMYVDRSAGREVFVKVTSDGETTDLSGKMGFDAYFGELDYFCDCVAGGKAPSECMPADCADSIRIVMAEMESADKGGAKVCL